MTSDISLKQISNFASHTMETFKRKRVGFRIVLLYQTLIYQTLFLGIWNASKIYPISVRIRCNKRTHPVEDTTVKMVRGIRDSGYGSCRYELMKIKTSTFGISESTEKSPPNIKVKTPATEISDHYVIFFWHYFLLRRIFLGVWNVR